MWRSGGLFADVDFRQYFATETELPEDDSASKKLVSRSTEKPSRR